MPSLVTPRAADGSMSGSSKSFSRVNSFKRDWGNEEVENPPKSSLKGSSTHSIEWSASPEQQKPKTETRAASPAPVVHPMNETAADRRRKAILAALQPNADGFTSSFSSASSSTVGSRAVPSSSFYPPRKALVTLDDDEPSSGQRASATEELPSIPSRSAGVSSAGESKKRAFPWNEDILVAKKAMQNNSSTSKRSGSTGSSGLAAAPTMNIKQKIVLSTEQQQVLQLVVAEGKNMFFTGSAGTGKSVLLREIITSLRRKFATATDAVAVTASTGIAACNIGGVTLHSFAGCGLGNEDAKALVAKIKKQKKSVARWVRTKVLIIDEVSMVDGAFFDKLCKIGQMLRKNERPFGGLQIIVTGDFFQLPPVTKGGGMPKFCFEAATWNETIHMSVNLNKVFRQKDQRFIDMLNEMRFGRLTPATIQTFKSLSRPLSEAEDGLEATELFPRREDVDRANLSRLRQLNTDGWSYSAVDSGAITDPIQREKILSNFLAPKMLNLNVDAQVMLIKNTDETLVNGSMGRVIGFCHKIQYDTDNQGRWVQEDRWAEMTDEDRAKKETALQVAISKLGQGARPLPVVRFKVPGGGFRDQLVEAEAFKAELPNGEVQAQRSQLPLILAWAMSIHKSQGQTLERVKVDLGKVFEKGQAYVALSRATSLEGLQVLGFTADKVMAHRKVAQWSGQLKAL